ncbi:MAG: DUF6471 domain-containing protein [Salinivirgaceae bacterium]|jgi:hypothetical protein|nr:DUF6471 domain-containing protein [Salinivirgaceae bacterium]
MAKYNWNELSKRLLKAELVKRGISHEELAYRLNELGIKETKSSIDSKICRGTFSASFMLQCLNVIGCNNLLIQNELLIAAEPIVKYKKSFENETN